MLIWNSPFTIFGIMGIMGIMGGAICTVKSPFASFFTQVPLGRGEERHVERKWSLCERVSGEFFGRGYNRRGASRYS
jgi:hypothetical protein